MSNFKYYDETEIKALNVLKLLLVIVAKHYPLTVM